MWSGATHKGYKKTLYRLPQGAVKYTVSCNAGGQAAKQRVHTNILCGEVEIQYNTRRDYVVLIDVRYDIKYLEQW